MKIKMAASMLLCSFVILCSEVNAAGLSGQLLQSADCGCEAAPVVEDCGCEAAADEGCGCRQPVRGLLSKLRSSGCGCGGDCEAAAVPAPAVDCGCDAAPSCGCKSGGLKGLLSRMAGQVPGDCGCGPSCEETAPAVEASCGCAPEPAPAADCGCDAAPAAAPSCGCQNGGLLGRLKGRSCGCGSAPAPVADCGCAPEPAPAAECGCEAAAPSCGCDAAVGSSCGCGDASSGGCKLGKRLKSGCNRCGRSSCNGGCRNRGGLTLLNKLRGDRIVRDTSNCGRCMPACPNKGCDSGCGCTSCGCADGGVVYDYAPTMEVAPAMQPMAPVTAPTATEGSIVPSVVVPTGAMKKIQPVVDSAAFVLRNQK